MLFWVEIFSSGSVYIGKFISPLFWYGSFFPQSILKIIFTSLLWICLFNVKFIFTSCVCFTLHKYRFGVKHEISRHVLIIQVSRTGRGDSSFCFVLFWLYYFIFFTLFKYLTINFCIRSRLDMICVGFM